MLIRNEISSDACAIRTVVTDAMKLLPQSIGTEAVIVDRLRADNALSLSLVAEDAGAVVGYLAASRARIGVVSGWALIGPVAVLPVRHGEGIGSALIAEAILRLRASCKGAALVGDPGYYGRFGFRTFPGLRVGDCPQQFVQALPFTASEPEGELIHHSAFGLQQRV
ncbi:GNAT family N-acetyltransferase [Cereibacter changlensis JA139]|uniref:GNAT family N-acetyltransferase n=2 Tax=Cereibacter changlensis TaxID=402884 RepID=A0A2T4JLW0_9RHOB|nr:N-acetyltransferase [Cereibacter changlensis]PTE18884.1 GNAT family N-acetyltransferase [Cereibacter changlensis JA139]PZX45728.1 putative acetyltransferase [Cereibacter changlensis]